jgi:hypothetical protein
MVKLRRARYKHKGPKSGADKVGWRSGVTEYWSVGVLRRWRSGSEARGARLREAASVGYSAPALQHSTTPLLRSPSHSP